MMERQYKDSGIEWIGKIPEGWKMLPLAIFFAENSKPNSDLGSVNALQFKYGEIIQKPSNGKDLSEKDCELLEKYTVVAPDDIVVNGLNLNYDLKSLRIAKVRERGIITSAYIVLRPRNGANASYYNYYLKALDFQKIFHGMGVGIRLTLSYNELRPMLLPVPPTVEQQRIASYLDKKCGEIDALIALQEKMIAQLTEYKQAVITEAVTKGLDPNVKLVPSGIEWIGDVPEGWKVTRVKNYGTIRSGEGISLEEIKDEGKYPVWGGNGLMGYTGRYNEDKVSIVIGRVGALCGNVRLLTSPTFVSDNALIFRLCEIVDAKYMLWLLIGANLNRLNISNAQPLITGTKVKNVFFAIPPKKEQQLIASYLDTKCSEIDTLIALKRQKIESLNAYKKSVIYEAVTGKTIIE